MTTITRIPMSAPSISTIEVDLINEVLRTSSLSIGPHIVAFEEGLARVTDSRYAVAVSSGTAGLHLAVIAAGVTAGDIVITTPWSFVASSNCILYERAIPVFVDIDPVTGNIDPALVEQAVHDISQGWSSAERWLPPALRGMARVGEPPRVKAILPVHVFGQPADLDPLLATARRYGLRVIEDACEAIGAEYKGRRVGAIGDVGVFAFYPNKQMTTGEGGMIVTNNSEWDGLFRSLRNQGRDIFDGWLNHSRLGYNYRMDELSAALGEAQIHRIDELLASRDEVASWYNERLADIDLVEPPTVVSSTTRTSWQVYVVRILRPADRNTVMNRLDRAGVPSRAYFSPIHLQTFYRDQFGYGLGDFPVTEDLGEICLALPFSGVMTEDQVDYVCEQLRYAVSC